MPVSHQLKCVFVHVPRTGGTSIESALGLWGDWRQENTSSLFGMITSPDLKRRLGTTPFLQHLTASELGSVLPREFQRYYRFAFVRNPWDRLVSIHARMDQHMHAVAQSAGLQLGGTSFDQFLELTQNFEHVQLAPQHGFILDSAGDLAVDFLMDDDPRFIYQAWHLARSLLQHCGDEEDPMPADFLERTTPELASLVRRLTADSTTGRIPDLWTGFTQIPPSPGT